MVNAIVMKRPPVRLRSTRSSRIGSPNTIVWNGPYCEKTSS